MTLASTVNHDQEDASSVSVTDYQKVKTTESAILSTKKAEERQQSQKDYSTVDFGSIVEDVSPSLTLPLSSTVGSHNHNNGSFHSGIHCNGGISNNKLAEREREQGVSSHLQAIMGLSPLIKRAPPNITDNQKVLERLNALNHQTKKCDLTTSKTSLNDESRDISTDAHDKLEKKKTSLTTKSTHNCNKTSSKVSRDQSPRRHTISVANKSVSASSSTSVKEEAGNPPSTCTGDPHRVTSTSKMRQSEANKDDEPQKQLKSRPSASASKRRHENKQNNVEETKANNGNSLPKSPLAANHCSRHDTKKNTKSKRGKTGSPGRSSSARPSRRAESYGPSPKKAQPQQPEGDALSKPDSDHSPKRNNPSKIRSSPPQRATPLPPVHHDNNEEMAQQAKTEPNSSFINEKNEKEKTSPGWMVDRKKYALFDQAGVDDIPEKRVNEPISVATSVNAATEAAVAPDQARAASPRRATAPVIQEPTIRAGPEKNSKVSRRLREGSVTNRRRPKKEPLDDSSASASDSRRRVTLSSSSHHKPVDRNCLPGNDPEAAIPRHSKRISKALDDHRGRRGRSSLAVSQHSTSKKAAASSGGHSTAGGPGGRLRSRRMSVSLSPVRKATSRSRDLTAVVMRRKQHSFRSLLSDNDNDQGPFNEAPSKTVAPERMTASSLKERLRNLVSLDSKETKYGDSGGDDDQTSCSHSCTSAVVVPFVNEIPRDILKIQKQKDHNSPQFMYAGEFSDLFDDESDIFSMA